MTADGATAGSHTLIGGAMGGSAEAAGLAILLFVVAYLYAEEDPE